MGNKILVVNSDPMVVTLVKDVLTAQGYKVITASDGKPGLEAAQKERPDLVLLDIMMPGMDGYSVASQLKADTQTAKIPVVMLTAIGFDLNKELALQLGALDYVVKPFDIKHLLDVIKKFA